MNGFKRTSLAASLFLISAVGFAADQSSFNNKVNNLLSAHYQKYKEMEYFSGASLSVYRPNNEIKSFYIGNVSHDSDSKKMDEKTLFQIGSISKSFTAALMLQLEKEKKISLSAGLETWLGEYKKWSGISITQLLNMTSGLPNYSDTPAWNADEFQNPARSWSSAELIYFVYPLENYSPPLKAGYFYTNTGYIITQVIAEKVTKSTFKNLLTEKVINKAGLKNTFYPVPSSDSAVQVRMAGGYNYNQYDNPYLVGRNMHDNDLSWAGAAGAIISNSEDIIKWVQALFIGHDVLDAAQKKKLTTLMSVQSGKPISKVAKDEPRGFGLGVIQAFDPAIGTFWFYEGETLGYRALYFYVPCNGVIISSIFNSATNAENDHSSELMKKTYSLMLKEYPALQCKA